MIEKVGANEYALVCDYCGEDSGEFFERFTDAVEYKKDPDNHWYSVKDKDGDWQELCPSCNQSDIISRIRGYSDNGDDIYMKDSAKKLACLALHDFDDF